MLSYDKVGFERIVVGEPQGSRLRLLKASRDQGRLEHLLG